MVVAGVLAGPGYYLYCTQFSGKQVGKFPIAGRATSWSLPGGVTLAFPGNGAFRPFSVDLDPQMNPLGFIWHGRVSGLAMTHPEHNQYKASLYLGKQRLMVETFSISRGKDDKGTQWASVTIGAFSVPHSGQYHFVLEEAARSQLTVGDMQIELRRNIIVPSIPVAITGFGLLIAGILLAIVALMWNKKKLTAAEKAELEAFLAAHKPAITGRHMLIAFGVGVILMGGLFLIVTHYVIGR